MSDMSSESLSVPEPLRAILDEHDARTDDFDEADLGFILKARFDECGEVGELWRKACFAEVAAFQFSDRLRKEKNPWGTRFGPLIAATREDGTTYFFPDIAQVDNAIIQYWSRRSQEAQHPVLKARYADLTWDLAKAATGRRRPIQMAWQAIDAYVESGCRFSDSGMAKGRFERALELALSVKDTIRVGHVVDAMLQLLDNARHPGFYVTWVFDVLYHQKGVILTEDQQTKLIDSLEAELRRICNSASPVGIVAKAPAVRLAKHYQRISQPEQVKRVIRSYGNALARFANGAEGPVAMHWFEESYATYVEFGLKEEAQHFQIAAKTKGEEAISQMVPIKHSVKIPDEEMEQFLAETTEGDLESTLTRIAINFTPRLDDIRRQLEETKEKARLVSMIPLAKLGENQVIARAGSIDGDPEGRLMFQMADNLKFSASLLQVAIDRTRGKYDFSARTVLPFLLKSPLFGTDRGPLLEHAITAYVRGDHITTIHVLVPQIEHTLRQLLGMLGKPTNKHRRSDLSVMVEKTLNDILESEQAIQDCLGEDMVTYLRVFLCDPRGLNVRNNVAHGLMKPAQFHRSISDRLLHIILVLAHIRASEEPSSGNEAGE